MKFIFTYALKGYDGKISICDRNITYLYFAEDTDVLAEEDYEIEALVKVSIKPAQGTRWKLVLRGQIDDKQRQ